MQGMEANACMSDDVRAGGRPISVIGVTDNG